MDDAALALFEKDFPAFAQFLRSGAAEPIDEFLPPAPEAEIKRLEEHLGVPLPASYKRFLQIARGMTLMGGSLQMYEGHPFFHAFPPQERETPLHNSAVARKGGVWPPPSEGMLCFGEFCMEGDGDQVLFDVSGGLVDGEYPVFYYEHEQPSVRKLADNFAEWLEQIGDD